MFVNILVPVIGFPREVKRGNTVTHGFGGNSPQSLCLVHDGAASCSSCIWEAERAPEKGQCPGYHYFPTRSCCVRFLEFWHLCKLARLQEPPSPLEGMLATMGRQESCSYSLVCIWPAYCLELYFTQCSLSFSPLVAIWMTCLD